MILPHAFEMDLLLNTVFFFQRAQWLEIMRIIVRVKSR